MKPQLTQSPTLPENDHFNLLGSRATDHINAMLSYWDRDGICRFANQPYLNRFGLKKNQLVNVLRKEDLLGKEAYEKTLPYLHGVLEGKPQLYERTETSGGDFLRYSITSYVPDIQDNNVVGYFVQITDITPVKELEVKIRKLEKAKERELLRSVIETQELEREVIAYQLKESVNQTLAYCKLMLEKSKEKQKGSAFLKNFSTFIHQAIDELNALSTKMSPTVIKLLGFETGVREYIKVFEDKQHVAIDFECNNEIENMAGTDKIALFRILQNYLLTFVNHSTGTHIIIDVAYLNKSVSIRLVHNDPMFQIDKGSKEYIDILNRVEYYSGQVVESLHNELAILEIDLLDIPENTHRQKTA